MTAGIINIHVGIMFSEKFTDCTNTQFNFMIVGSLYCNLNQINTAVPLTWIEANHWFGSGTAVTYWCCHGPFLATSLIAGPGSVAFLVISPMVKALQLWKKYKSWSFWLRLKSQLFHDDLFFELTHSFI